jgi:hypothetical protein
MRFILAAPVRGNVKVNLSSRGLPGDKKSSPDIGRVRGSARGAPSAFVGMTLISHDFQVEGLENVLGTPGNQGGVAAVKTAPAFVPDWRLYASLSLSAVGT